MSADDLAANAPLLLDRFVSASTAQDVYSSLDQILQSLQAKHLTAADIYSEKEVSQALLQVLQTGSYKDLPIEEGPSLAVRIFHELAKDKTAPVLTEPSKGRLLETLVDVASDSESASYPRVLCLQTLRLICQSHSKLAQSQLLQAPNGLHRLGDLLQVSVDEQVRNEALLLAAVVAEWPSAAKVWMFSEVGDVVIQLAMEEGGLTGGNVLVLDCLSLLRNMLKHDAALADLVFQSPVLAQNLVRLLDLRGGKDFMYPKQPVVEEEEDDLDDLIQSGSKKKKPAVVVPKLTPSEEKVIEAVFDILSIVMESDSVKQMVWKKQTALVSLVWEMGLFYPPAPGTPYSCAVPSVQLQQRALQVTALYFSHAPTMDHHNGLDRLNLLVCTGGSGKTFQERMALSQSALHVIRRTLTAQTANEMLLHTMAPPMDDDGHDDQTKPKEATVVQKLLNTCFENMVEPNEKDIATEERRKLFLAGSFGALDLFLTDEASRSVLLRLTSGKVTLMDSILETLASNEDNKDDFVSLVLLRFLCHWVIEAPIVAQAMLLSTHSVALNMLFMSKLENVSTLASLLLGLAMEYMGEESKCGGWTASGMMEMVQKRGLSRFNSKLEKFKSVPKKELPWSCCTLEWQVWSKFYEDSVLIVRKRVVQALTAGGEESPEDGEEEATVSTSASVRSLQQLVSQQATEIDQLRASLDESKEENAAKEKELAAWKLRVESTPTQLDDMLTEYTSKNIALDQRISQLVEELRVKEEKHQSELKERDDTIASVQKELQESQAREVEAREERDSLREDMTALSQAYSSLEEEYRRQAESTSTAAAAPTGEEEDAGRQQPEGEVSQQTPKGSTEVAALRAENSRLRQDARAADDWMAMAVERMNTMGQQNAYLEQEVATLKEQLEHAGAAPSEGSDETGRLLSEETDRRMQLEAELSQERTLREQAEGQLALSQQKAEEQQEERLRRQELEGQVEKSRAELQSAVDSLEKVKSEREELVQKIEALSEDLVRSRGELSSLRESSSEDVGVDGRENEPYATEMQNQLSSARAELESVLQREQEAIDSRDLRIRELEFKLSEGSEGLTIEGIRSRDEEIEKLREANDAAQEWMAKAVEHNQVVSERLARLSEENESLSTQVKELTERLQSSHHMSSAQDSEQASQLSATVQSLQEQLEAKEDEANNVIAQWQQSYSSLEARCAQLQSQLDSTGGAKEFAAGGDASRINELEAMVESLQKDMRTQDEKASSVIAEWTKSHSTLEEKLTELYSVSEEKEQLGNRCISLEQQLHDIEKEKEELLQKAAVQHESEAGLECLRKEKDELLAREQQSRGEVAELQDQLREIEEKLADVSDQKTSERILELETTVESLRNELKAQENDATSVISQWQQSYAGLESQCTELQSQLAAIQDEKRELLPLQSADQERLEDTLREREDLLMQIKELESQLATVAPLEKEAAKDEPRNLGARGLPQEGLNQVAELESAIRSLKEEMEARDQNAASAMSQWQESYAQVESHALELESQVTALREEKEKLLEQPLQDLENEKQELISLKTETEAEFDALRKEKEELEELHQQSQDELTKVKSELTSLQARLSETSEEDASHVERIRQLEAEVDSLRRQMEAEGQEATSVIEQWRESYTSVESQLEAATKEKDELSSLKVEKEAELDALRKEKEELHQQNQDELTKLQSRLSEMSEEDASHVERIRQLEAEVDSLRRQMEAEGQEATSVIEQWREGYTSIESQLEAATKEKDELSSLKAEKEAELDALQKEKEELVARHEQSQDELTKVQSKLTNQQARLSETSEEDASHVERIQQLEAEVDSLRRQMEAEGQEATSVIEQWRESYTSIESQLEAATKEKDELSSLKVEKEAELDALRKETEELHQQSQDELTKVKSELTNLQARLSETSEEDACHVERIQQLEAEVDSLRRQMEAEGQEATSVIEQWRESYTSVESQLEAATKEKDELSIMKAEKEAELVALLKEKDELVARDEQSQDELMKVQSELTKLQVRISETSEEDASHVERIQQLEAEVDSLRRQMEAEGQEATSVIEQWRDSYTSIESQLVAATEEKDELCSLKVEKEAELDALQKEKDELVARHEQTQDELTKVKSELTNLQARLSETSEEDASHVERIQQLEAEVDSLRRQMEAEGQEATSVIEQWRESYTSIESQLEAATKEKDELSSLKVEKEAELDALRKEKEELVARDMQNRDELTKVQSELTELHSKYSEKIKSAEQDASRSQELENEIGTLQQQLVSQEAEAESVISQWQQSYSALEAQFNEVESQVALLGKEKQELSSYKERTESELNILRTGKDELTSQNGKLRKDIDAFSELDQQRHDELVKLRRQVGDLESKLEREENDASNAVSEWEDAYISLELELNELNRKFSEATVAKDELAANCARLEQQLNSVTKEKDNMSSSKTEVESEVGALRKERDDLLVRDQQNLDKLAKSKAQIEEAGANLSDLKSQVREAEEVVQQWAESYSELEAQLTAVESQLAIVSQELEQTKADADLAISSWEASCTALERKVEENEELFASRLEAKVSEHLRARETVDAQRLLEREHNEHLERERDELRSQRASIEEERDRLKIQVVELEDELRDANDAMQLHVTDEVSDKATEIAAKALRQQVHELRSRLEADTKAVAEEHEARLAAEKEVDRLRGDVAALLGMVDNEDTRGEIQRRTVEAITNFQRKESAEIEELKQALVRALDELESARAAEKEADERAAKASLQASMYEQEVVTLKSDLKFLSETLEETRDAESTRRGALDHRIASLERDNSVLRRCHAAEIENLRNELDQITMERDRLFQSLRESEKNKEALLHAKGQPSAGEESTEAEVIKLRLEKAQLLSASSEEASRAERRLREARAAEKASAESDVLLEKELRLAAEKALENVKLEMEELRGEANGKKHDGPSQDTNTVSVLEKELEDLKGKLQSLADKNDSIQAELEEAKEESKTKTEKLAEALAKLHTSQRDRRYEAEVRAEVARLQALHRKDVDNAYQLNPAEDEIDDGVIDDDDGPAAQLYDVIEKQKKAIEEERSMYKELLAEQDDLLALLAQQDLVKASLNAALVRVAGQEAVDEAIQEAEKEAVAKFGKYVKLTDME